MSALFTLFTVDSFLSTYQYNASDIRIHPYPHPSTEREEKRSAFIWTNEIFDDERYH